MTEQHGIALKMAVLGNPSVGKTSLIRRHAYAKFDEAYITTIGVDLTRWDHPMEGGRMLQVTIWDIAGQDSFARIRNIYLKGARTLLMVFDLTNRESFTDVPTWIEDARKITGEASATTTTSRCLEIAP